MSRLTSFLGRSPKLAVAIAATLVIAICATGGFVYAASQSSPTTVTLDIRDGAHNIATDRDLHFTFSRAVSYARVKGSLAFAPAAGGALFSNAD
ncbi:MAG TPA: hypothetical protein VJQ84_04505, partial [Solirubrobacterales bacterium]|nr:hypothetical protein [Solirubrobacterales bacterium]